MKTLKQVEAIDAICESTYKDLPLEEAEYQGKKVKLNDPIRGGSKKFYVYVKNAKGNIVKVSFGDTTGLSIKRDDPARRKSFRARHNWILQKIRQVRDTGLVINGVLVPRSITNIMTHEKSSSNT